MINKNAVAYLLAFPVGLMGCVHMCFSLLSMLVFADHEETEFLIPAFILIFCSVVLILTTRKYDISKIGFRDSLLFATLAWVVMGLLGAIPIVMVTKVSITDGVFESITALTTTGATVLTHLDEMPKSFLLYRQFLQWLGGLGVVVFIVAVLPMLNIGGMKLLKAETPGPIKNEKLAPRISHAAHYLWFVYITITILCVLSYYFAGMNIYDAIAHSFTTVSTGGFSTHDASLGYYHNTAIFIVSDVFMLLGAISFALHFKVIETFNIAEYWRNEEARTFLLIVFCLSLILSLILLSTDTYTQPLTALNLAVFHLISFITSTGFGAASVNDWPLTAALLLLVAAYLGGCTGSTAGGNKIIRFILTIKLIMLETKRLIHPKGVFSIKYQGRPVDAAVLSATMAFMSIAAFSSLLLCLVLMSTGLDFWSSLTAVAACLNVLGPGFGELGANFIPVSDVGTWVLSFTMILGRLEYFTVLALFLPSFWRE